MSAGAKEPTPIQTATQVNYASQFVFPSESALETLPRQQREKAVAQRLLFLKQSDRLFSIVSKQLQLTGRNPLAVEQAEESVPLALSQVELESTQQVEAAKDMDTPAATASPKSGLPSPTQTATPPGPSSAGKASRLTPEAEQQLLAFFAIQDTLSKEAAVHLANEVKCSEAQVREYFTRLRSSVRNFMQKLQRKASGVPVGSHAAPAASGIPSAIPGSPPDPAAAGSEDPAGTNTDAAAAAALPVVDEQQARADALREEGLNKLRSCLTGEGGIHALVSAETVATIMKTARSWTVKEACLQAIQQTTTPGVLQQLMGTVHLIAMLASWLEEAERDGQTSFMRSLLHALQRFPPLTSESLHYVTLPAVVMRLQKHRSLQIADASCKLLQRWGLLEAPAEHTKPPPASLPKGGFKPLQMAVPLSKSSPGKLSSPKSPASKPRKRAALDKPLSADDIVRAKAVSRGKGHAASGLPNKSARLDASSLAEVRGPSRYPAAPFRPKPQKELDQHRVHKMYRDSQQRLARAAESRRSIEASRAAKAVIEIRSGRYEAQTPAAFPAPLLLDWTANGTTHIAQGEESSEVHVQANRTAWQPAATYASRDLIPPSPAERLLEEPPEPRHHTARIPFVPADRHEALDQVNLLRSNGVLLSHLLVLSGQGSILPKAGVFQPCPLPVQGSLETSQLLQPAVVKFEPILPSFNAQYIPSPPVKEEGRA